MINLAIQLAALSFVVFTQEVHYLTPDEVSIQDDDYDDENEGGKTTHVCSDRTPGLIYSHENITSSHIVIASKETSMSSGKWFEGFGAGRKRHGPDSELTFCSIVFSPAPPATSLLLAVESYSHPCPNLLFICAADVHPKDHDAKSDGPFLCFAQTGDYIETRFKYPECDREITNLTYKSVERRYLVLQYIVFKEVPLNLVVKVTAYVNERSSSESSCNGTEEPVKEHGAFNQSTEVATRTDIFEPQNPVKPRDGAFFADNDTAPSASNIRVSTLNASRQLQDEYNETSSSQSLSKSSLSSSMSSSSKAEHSLLTLHDRATQITNSTTPSSISNGTAAPSTLSASPSSTPWSGFWCAANRICIEPRLVCDGKDDCLDGGTDEKGCLPETTTTMVTTTSKVEVTIKPEVVVKTLKSEESETKILQESGDSETKDRDDFVSWKGNVNDIDLETISHDPNDNNADNPTLRDWTPDFLWIVLAAVSVVVCTGVVLSAVAWRWRLDKSNAVSPGIVDERLAKGPGGAATAGNRQSRWRPEVDEEIQEEILRITRSSNSLVAKISSHSNHTKYRVLINEKEEDAQNDEIVRNDDAFQKNMQKDFAFVEEGPYKKLFSLIMSNSLLQQAKRMNFIKPKSDLAYDLQKGEKCIDEVNTVASDNEKNIHELDIQQSKDRDVSLEDRLVETKNKDGEVDDVEIEGINGNPNGNIEGDDENIQSENVKDKNVHGEKLLNEEGRIEVDEDSKIIINEVEGVVKFELDNDSTVEENASSLFSNISKDNLDDAVTERGLSVVESLLSLPNLTNLMTNDNERNDDEDDGENCRRMQLPCIAESKRVENEVLKILSESSVKDLVCPPVYSKNLANDDCDYDDSLGKVFGRMQMPCVAETEKVDEEIIEILKESNVKVTRNDDKSGEDGDNQDRVRGIMKLPVVAESKKVKEEVSKTLPESNLEDIVRPRYKFEDLSNNNDDGKDDDSHSEVCGRMQWPSFAKSSKVEDEVLEILSESNVKDSVRPRVNFEDARNDNDNGVGDVFEMKATRSNLFDRRLAELEEEFDEAGDDWGMRPKSCPEGGRQPIPRPKKPSTAKVWRTNCLGSDLLRPQNRRRRRFESIDDLLYECEGRERASPSDNAADSIERLTCADEDRLALPKTSSSSIVKIHDETGIVVVDTVEVGGEGGDAVAEFRESLEMIELLEDGFPLEDRVLLHEKRPEDAVVDKGVSFAQSVDASIPEIQTELSSIETPEVIIVDACGKPGHQNHRKKKGDEGKIIYKAPTHLRMKKEFGESTTKLKQEEQSLLEAIEKENLLLLHRALYWCRKQGMSAEESVLMQTAEDKVDELRQNMTCFGEAARQEKIKLKLKIRAMEQEALVEESRVKQAKLFLEIALMAENEGQIRNVIQNNFMNHNIPLDQEDQMKVETILTRLSVEQKLETAFRNDRRAEMEDALKKAHQLDPAVRMRASIKLKMMLVEDKLGKVMSLENLRMEILTMNIQCIIEVFSYVRPPVAVEIVIRAVLTLLGFQETRLKSWRSIKREMHQMGTESMRAKIVDLDPRRVSQTVGLKAEKLLTKFDLSTIHAVSKPVAAFYRWAFNIINQVKVISRPNEDLVKNFAWFNEN